MTAQNSVRDKAAQKGWGADDMHLKSYYTEKVIVYPAVCKPNIKLIATITNKTF